MLMPIIVGAIAMFVVGAIWFTVLFGKMWSSLMGFTLEQRAKADEGGMASKMVIMFILNLVTASVFAYLLPELLSESFSAYLSSVLLIWLGFVFPVQVGPLLWEGKSWKILLINVGHGVISFTVLASVIYYLS